MLNSVSRYIVDHWRGEQSLFRSFWINFVALRAVLFSIQTYAFGQPETDYTTWGILIWGYMLVAHLVIFIWQVVGVLRAAETWLRDTGSQATVWGAQLSLVVGLFLTISYGIEAWQATWQIPEKESFLTRMDREHASKYALKLDADGTVMRLDGSIELGISRNMRGLLASNRQISLVVLNSTGGNIFEARGLARLFRENAISTRVENQCSSACTAAFVGGNPRIMKRGARLGFHQYRVDADYTVLNVDPGREQERDIKLFESQGVSRDFLEKVFARPSNDMWFPDATELLAAGFIHLVED